MALPKQNRLKGKREFSKVFTGTQPFISKNFSLQVKRDQENSQQVFAVVVPTKIVPLASARNHLRRRVSDALSHIMNKTSISQGIGVIISLRAINLPDGETLKHELLSLMKKSGILYS